MAKNKNTNTTNTTNVATTDKTTVATTTPTTDTATVSTTAVKPAKPAIKKIDKLLAKAKLQKAVKEQMSFKFDPATVEALKKLCADTNTPMTSFVEEVLKDILEIK